MNQWRLGRSYCQCLAVVLSVKRPGDNSIPASRWRIHQRQARVGYCVDQQDQARSSFIQHHWCFDASQSIARYAWHLCSPRKNSSQLSRCDRCQRLRRRRGSNPRCHAPGFLQVPCTWVSSNGYGIPKCDRIWQQLVQARTYRRI